MEEFDNYLFRATVTPRNRKEIRAMMQDRKRFEPLLVEAGNIIETAIKNVNNEEDEPYRTFLYNTGLWMFNDICNRIERVKKPKYWKLNRRFYAETVKPIV